jgi:transposase InsO family protein
MTLNAVGESLFAKLKKEFVQRRSWPTRRELIFEVFEYVEAFYSRTRQHSARLPRTVREQNLHRRHGASLAASRFAPTHPP